MARIPEHEVERLKREVSVQRLAEARGIKLHRHGADLLGLCPFHDDRNPSLVITPAKNLWHCLGACNAGGSSIDWVMRAQGVSFRHAVELLRADHLPLAAEPIKPVRQSTVRTLPPPIAPEADDRVLLLEIVDYYHDALKQSPEALKYLQSRGLQSSEMFDRFKLGFANRTLGYRLEAKNRAGGALMRGRLQRLGILRESGHEHFNGSVIVPVFDSAGAVVEMYGRKITASLREGTPLHLYLPGAHRGVWNEEALTASKEIILCEALIDALTFWCAGFRNVTASYGVNGFTQDHRAAFEKHGTERVYIAYDRDDAGNNAAEKLAEELIAMGVECFRVQFPKGMDANEYALKVTPAAKSLGVLLNRAEWLGKGKRPEPRVLEPVITVAPVIESEPVIEPEPEPMPEPQIETAAKEEIIEETPDPEPSPAALIPAATEERVFSLAADAQPDEPVEPEPGPAMPAPSINVPVETRGEDIFLQQGDRRYRVRGLSKNMSYELLRVNVLVSGTTPRGESAFHVDTLDLYSARQRGMFTKQAAEELGVKEDVIRHDLGRVLLKLEELQDEQIKKALQPVEKEIQLGPEERAAAMELLSDPRLLDRIVQDFAQCGVVGEETNKLVGYLGVVSRHLDAPLAVIVQSSSAAGKSSLMEAVLAFVPDEQRVQYSAMTGQSLFYMGEQDLKHKVLAIVEEEGASRASYALKLLQSEGVLTIASTGKDPATGRLLTHQYRVEGPVMIFLTTTAIHLDEELLNRCLVLSVNEEREQTQAIHRVQREAQTLEGLLQRKDREAILAVHRNAQRLLKPVFVANPYARELTFLDAQTRTRRDHMKYLTLIRAIALLHQYQRPHKTIEHRGRTVEYIEVALNDIAVANRLAHEVLGRSLDELPPQTRRLLLAIDEMVTAECTRTAMTRSDYRFSRRDVREAIGWGDTQLKIHLHRLEEMEYLIAHRGGRGQSFVYELAFERQADSAKPVLPGLIDVDALGKHHYDGKKSGLRGQLSGSSRPQVGGMSGSLKTAPPPISMRVEEDTEFEIEENTYRGSQPNGHYVVAMAGGKR
ncbi:MAG TPA: CHC2 zinc finger domain-containing protein [Terracidiphilus sp.]|jgi:DNA primase catalytic core